MRVRALFALLATPAVALAVGPRAAVADSTGTSTSPFGAYIASGDASCLEFTLTTGYSFIVEPDARLPRATATISEGTASALAAPADPGDSTDALAGLLVPRAEGMLAAGLDQATGSIPVPVVPAGLTDSLISQVANPVNPHLEYPYEHASAAYPNPQQPGDQQASYLGLPSTTFADPSGVISVDGALGDAKAGAGVATADSGAAAATSLPLLGVSVGRFSASSTALVSPSAVTNDVVCNLQDVTIAPPASGFALHIGTLIATLHTERKLGANGATSSHSLQLANVTLNGQNIAPGPQGGLPLPATTYTVPQPPLPPGVPAPPASLQTVSITGTTSAATLSAANNESTSTLTGATVVITSTAPVPSSIPPQPGQNPISTTPAVYTIQLANLDSQTYGLVAPSFGSAASSASGTTGAGAGSSYFGGSAGGRSGGFHLPGTSGSNGSKGSHPVTSSVLIPGTPAAIRWSVVGLAGLLEALLLTSVFLRRRMSRPRRVELPAAAFLDLP
jgi:hypothetical protein